MAAPTAQARVETLNLAGVFGRYSGSPITFTGAIDLDFNKSFTSYTVTSIEISVKGHSVFDKGTSLSISPSVGIIGASNSAGDKLDLWFAAPASGTWAGFEIGDISFGYILFSNLMGSVGASGAVTSEAPIPAPVITEPPPVNDPPPVTSASAPELSTWAMMLVGLAGLGLATMNRRSSAFLSGRA